MGKLIYSAIASADGYTEDAAGTFDWAAPSEEVHRFVNDLERRVGTMLYGRRMYETMVWWETQGDDTDVGRDYAATWRAADKVVYSRTLERPSSARTHIERNFDVEAVRAMRDSASKDLTIGGPELAAQAIDAGLVDELQMFVVPVLVGAGKEALPVRTFSPLALADERRFSNGTVYLRYRVDR
jgi:dihydrofolate reductase